MRLGIPCIYFVFYDFFFKSSAGDAHWKKACSEAGSQSTRIASIQAEAFAMLQLKNNYFAWLLEAKEKLKDLLVTDYDTDTKIKNKTGINEAYLKCEIDLEKDENDLIQNKEDDGYNDLKKQTEAALKKARKSAKNNSMYKDMAKQLNKPPVSPDEEGFQEYDDTAREKQRKRRCLLKSFRKYTAREDGEDGFKGWSHRAAEDMTLLVKKLMDERKKMAKFTKAFRKVYASRHQTKRKVIEQKDVDVDYDALWGDLEDSQEVAV